MLISSFNSAAQVNSATRLNKKRFNLASLPTIDPHLVSIASLVSRLIPEMDDAFTLISNAATNDGCEVTILRWYGGIPGTPYWCKEERVEIDAAFNILIANTFDRLHDLIREWWYKHFRIFLFGMDFINSPEKIEPNAPIEIKYALQAIRLASVKRKPLEDMLELSQRQRCGFLTAN